MNPRGAPKSAVAALGVALLLTCGVASAGGTAPTAELDLANPAHVALLKAEWRYHDVRLVPVQHPGPDAAGQPTAAPQPTWDIEPHAGARDFDDTAWPRIEPSSVAQRRGAGRVSFNWYRISLTIPERIGDFETRGASVELTTSLDDYAEVWVDGELPRVTGQSGGSVIHGWNGVNRLQIGRALQPGRRIQLAIYGINGPLSDPPANFIWIREARLVFRAGAPGDDEPHAVVPQEVNLTVTRRDPAIDVVVPANPKLFKLAEGFRFTEGPVWLRGLDRLLFSDPNANRIYAYDARSATLSVFREPAGYEGRDIVQYAQPGSNGLAVDAQGRLIVNQHGNRRVLRLEADGRMTVLADRYRGHRLNSPNDLVLRSDGSVYFTDPPFGLPEVFADRRKELPFSGVYRAVNGKVALLSSELTGPNGIAFSPDERFLYVGNWDPRRKQVLRFPVRADGNVGSPSVFADMTAELPGDEALDGIKIDVQGNVYVAAPDGLRIYAPDGRHLGTLTAPRPIHNIAWGGEDGRTLYLCARDRLYRIDLAVAGVRR
jgi:gluconolactonase